MNYSSLNEINALTLENLEIINREVITVQRNIEEKLQIYKNKPKIILIGVTGSGKSTLLCSLTNKNLRIAKNGSKIYLDGEGVMGGAKSYTKIPQMSLDPNIQILLCDCPGFEDTDGPFQEIINAFSIEAVLNSRTNDIGLFKILLVISESDFRACRYSLFVKCLTRLEEMFPNLDELKKGLGLIITKGHADEIAEDYINELNENPPFRLLKWRDFFISNLDHVFVFPKPSKNSVGKQYDFEDRERLMQFLSSNYIDPAHNVSLSETARLQMIQLRSNHTSRIAEVLNSICFKINKQIQSVSNSNDLEKWLEIMNELLNRNVKESKDFEKVIKEMVPKCEQYEQEFMDLSKFETFDMFMDKILYKAADTSSIKQFVQGWCTKAIAEILNSSKRIKDEEHRIQEMEYEKREIELRKKELQSQQETIKQSERLEMLITQIATTLQNNENNQKRYEMQFREDEERRYQQRIEESRIMYEKRLHENMKNDFIANTKKELDELLNDIHKTHEQNVKNLNQSSDNLAKDQDKIDPYVPTFFEKIALKCKDGLKKVGLFIKKKILHI